MWTTWRFSLPPTSVTNDDHMETAIAKIQAELEEQLKVFEAEGKLLEAQRLKQRTDYDIEMLREMGYTNGVENYSRHMDGRSEGEPPYTLLDFFLEDYLIMIDESHMTMGQIKGMYNGDRSRKEMLVNYGFRLPSALDNRPLRREEFESHVHQIVYVSATPGDYEMEQTDTVVEQIIRPTGLLIQKWKSVQPWVKWMTSWVKSMPVLRKVSGPLSLP